MRRYILIPLVLFCFTVTADIYKSVDDEGTIHYSDKETEGAEPVELSKGITYPAPDVSNGTASKEGLQQEFNYTSISIVKPEMNETIHDNSGNVTVGITLVPVLRPKHTITLYMDGKELLKGKKETSFNLQNIDRGSHTLRASVLDKNSVVLISSKSVIFHLRRVTVNEEKEEDKKDNSNAFKPDYDQDQNKGADYEKGYDNRYEKDFKKGYDGSGSYEDGAKKNNEGIPSNSGNFKSGNTTYSPNYNQK